jgi:hypothetical protein
MTQQCIDAIAETIAHDTGYRAEEAQLLSIGLSGLMEVGARWWLTSKDRIPKDRAVELLVACPGAASRALRSRTEPLRPRRTPPLLGRRGLAAGESPYVRRRAPVEVKIGVQDVARELVLESAQSPAEVEKAVAEALKATSACWR